MIMKISTIATANTQNEQKAINFYVLTQSGSEMFFGNIGDMYE
jgi:hypothetical protein